MLFSNISLLDENFSLCQDMYLATKDDRIVYIGKTKPSGDFGREYDGKNRLLTPGFYNAHAHSPMALMRGYGENLALQDWLNTRIFPFEDKLSGNAVYWATMLCMAESIRFGIVSSSDMYYFTEDMVRAVLDSGAKNNISSDSGAKNNISRAISNPFGTPVSELPSIREMRESVRFNGLGNGRVKIDASLHAEYTSDEATARAVADFAKEENLNMHVHVSETKLEHEECKERRDGRTPVRYLNDCGIFDTPSIAAHCVWIEGEDYDILKEKGVAVATNPVSNLKLASGICDVPALLEKGINVAIGTDSVASNNNLSFLEEIKTMALVAKVKHMDPTLITPLQALYAATRGGALAQGRDDCGVIKEGMKADLLAFRTDTPEMNPVHDMMNNMVYSASDGDIAMTMIDGEVLYEDGEFTKLDTERICFEAGKATEGILKEL